MHVRMYSHLQKNMYSRMYMYVCILNTSLLNAPIDLELEFTGT